MTDLEIALAATTTLSITTAIVLGILRHKLVKELHDLWLTIRKAKKDGKINAKEWENILNEATDILSALKKVVKDIKTKKGGGR